MAATDEDRQLLQLLEAQPILRERHFTWDCGPTGGVVVMRKSHVIGVWHFDGAQFGWTPAGNRIPTHHVATAMDALRYTVVVLSVQK